MAHIGALNGRLAAHCNDLGTTADSHATSAGTAHNGVTWIPAARATHVVVGLDGATDPP
jgi:hypothetical protein